VKPNLFIVGAPKSGTTAWVEYLRDHPQVYFPSVKEPYHFCPDFPGDDWRIEDRDQYLALFANSGDAKAVGEASVWYLYSEVAASEIRKFNPDANIIILLRNQEDQLPSLHNQLIYNGVENILEFEEAWRMSGKRDRTNMLPRSPAPRLLDYRAQGTFSPQVERYFSEFPAEQVRVFHFDDWVRDPRAAYVEILRLLDLDDDGRTDFPPVNEATRHRWGVLGRFTQRPPAWALKAAALVKRITGRSRPPLVDWIRSLNNATGYRTDKAPDELAREIREYFAGDNSAVAKRIWRPAARS